MATAYSAGWPWYVVHNIGGGPDAAVTECPYCRRLIVSDVRIEEHCSISWVTHLAAVLCCLIGCFSCALLPYCLGMYTKTIHTCPYCRKVLEVYESC